MSGGQFGARFIDDRLGVLLGQFLKFLIPFDGLLDGGGLIARDVAGKVLAVFPGLMLVVRPLRAFAHDGQFAAFHPLNLCDLFEQLSRFGNIHAGNIYDPRYYVTQNRSFSPF